MSAATVRRALPSFLHRRKRRPASGSPAYLLTDDIVGIGTRHAALWERTVDARAFEVQQEEVLRKRIVERKPLAHLGFAPDDPFALSPEQMRSLEGQESGGFDG